LIEGKRILITGGAGFIGSNLVKRLYETNYITVYDNFERDSLTELRLQDVINIIKGDVVDSKSVERVFSQFKPQIVIHCAAKKGIVEVTIDPLRTMEVNIEGTKNLLNACVKHPVEKFINFSTTEVFGRLALKGQEPQRVDMGIIGSPRWSYAISKMTAEYLTIFYNQQHKVPSLTVRPCNIYGPGLNGEGAPFWFINQALRGEDLTVHGDGTQTRSWCYIDDFIEGIDLILDNDASIGNSFNIGDPRFILTIYGFAREIINTLGSKSQIKHVERPEADVEFRMPNIRKSTEVLGYYPERDLTEAILETAKYYRGKM